MSPPLRTIILVSHTHWDREWYLPFEDFRWQLVKTVDQLLDLMESDARYRNFTLDGQTILLDDYLEIRPTHRSRIEKLIKAGRLHIGPWYVLADEFLVSGEALIRNLLYGHQIARQFGEVMPIGYVPDTFGHIAQLPQILKGFDLDTSVWWRGLEDNGTTPPTELCWRAPDGSEVLAVHLRTSYSTAANLPNSVEVALAQLIMPMNVLALRRTSSSILLMNGSDHLPPQPFLPDLLEALNHRLKKKDVLAGKTVSELLQESIKSPLTSDATGVEGMGPFIDELFSDFLQSLSGAQFLHGTFMDYIKIIRDEVDIKQLPLIEGEQHSSKYVPILPGVFSARLYLKQANYHTQQLLERWVEPFATIAWWLGASYPTNSLRRAWQLLLQNHPHDSICGCSVDATHADMERRFAWSQQIGNQILSEAIAYINNRVHSEPPSTIPEPCLAIIRVYNPNPQKHTDILRILLHPSTPINPATRLALYDSSGTKVPVQVIKGSELDQSLSHLIDIHALPEKYAGEPTIRDPEQQLLLSFIATEIPALGYQTFYLAPDTPDAKTHKIPPLKIIKKDDVYIIENPIIKLQISQTNGTLELYHKPTKKRYRHLLVFEDSGDIGDEYNYCPPSTDKRITSLDQPKTKILIIEQGPVTITLEITSHLTVPAQAHESRKRRSSKMTKISIQNLVTVYANQPRIDILTSLKNTARDHRLRVLFPSDISAETAWGDTPFYVVERPLIPTPQDWGSQLYPMMMDFYLTSILNRPNVPGKPLGWFEDSTTTHAQQSFVDVNDGLQGLLIASKGLPEYEVLNDQRRTIALTLLRSVGWLSRNDLTTRRGDAGPQLETPGAQCLGNQVCHYSIIPHHGSWYNHETQHQIRAFITPLKVIQIQFTGNGDLPPKQGFLSLEPINCVFSCLKKAEDTETTILRLYEINGKQTTARLCTTIPVKQIKHVNLAEKPLENSIVKSKKSNTVVLQLPSYGIRTIQFTTEIQTTPS